MRFAFVEDHRRVIPVNRLCACWDLSPRPRMRISSFIRSRSDVVLSSVIGTSTVDWESPIVRQGRKIARSQNTQTDQQEINTCHKRHCRASGFVRAPLLRH